MNSKALNKVLQKLSNGQFPEELINALSFSELQTLFLHVLEEKTKRITPAMIIEQYRNDSYVFPSNIAQKEQIKLANLLNL